MADIPQVWYFTTRNPQIIRGEKVTMEYENKVFSADSGTDFNVSTTFRNIPPFVACGVDFVLRSFLFFYCD